MTPGAAFPPSPPAMPAGPSPSRAPRPSRGQTYGIFVTTGVKSRRRQGAGAAAGLGAADGAWPAASTDASKSTVSSVGDLEASCWRSGAGSWPTLLESQLFSAATGINRDDLAYLYAFTCGDAMNISAGLDADPDPPVVRWPARWLAVLVRWPAARAGPGGRLSHLRPERRGAGQGLGGVRQHPRAGGGLVQSGRAGRPGPRGLAGRRGGAGQQPFRTVKAAPEVKTEPGRFFLPTVFATRPAARPGGGRLRRVSRLRSGGELAGGLAGAGAHHQGLGRDGHFQPDAWR